MARRKTSFRRAGDPFHCVSDLFGWAESLYWVQVCDDGVSAIFRSGMQCYGVDDLWILRLKIMLFTMIREIKFELAVPADDIQKKRV
jgi:hypothetical protein